ncbi:MAG: DMP19 family protein [Woeseiaceae bacterium]
MSTDTPFLESYDGQSTDELIALEEKFEIVSIVLAFEAALQTKDNLSKAERVVLSVEAIEREVNNGGFNQFFVNSSREFAPYAVESLNVIGCPQTAELCQKAVDLLGVEDLFDSDALDDAACDADDDLMEQFNALDETYYAGAEEPIAVKLFEFIKRNKKDISLDEMAGTQIRLC